MLYKSWKSLIYSIYHPVDADGMGPTWHQSISSLWSVKIYLYCWYSEDHNFELCRFSWPNGLCWWGYFEPVDADGMGPTWYQSISSLWSVKIDFYRWYSNDYEFELWRVLWPNECWCYFDTVDVDGLGATWYQSINSLWSVKIDLCCCPWTATRCIFQLHYCKC